MTFTITAYTLRHLLSCERRLWLDQVGAVDVRDKVSPAAFAAGLDHEKLISAAAFGPTTTVPAASWPEMVQITRQLMEQGVKGIQGAAFESELEVNGQSLLVRGRMDWLVRSSGSSHLGQWLYEPIEIKRRGKLVEEDKLQLDLYLWFLQSIQGTDSSGWFWMGRDEDDQPLNVIQHNYNPNRLFRALAQVTQILTLLEAPPIFLSTPCKTCPWHSDCEQLATARQDVALLPGLTRTTWQHLRREGIYTLPDVLTAGPDKLKQFKGIGRSRAYELTAHAQAVVTQLPVLKASLPEAVQLPGVMLDLETRLDDGRVWCFGWQGADGRTQAAVVDRYFDGDQLTLPDGQVIRIITDSDEGWRLIAAAAQELPGPVYHWGSFEKGVLRQTAPDDVTEALIGRMHDLNATFRRTCSLPVRGTSIKKVAPYLGFHWPEGTNAFTAWDDYTRWLLESNTEALARACAYNRADVDALALIWQWMQVSSSGNSSRLGF